MANEPGPSSKWSLRDPSSWGNLVYDAKARAIAFQALLLLALLLLGYEIVSNTAANLKKQNVASGFGFLGRTAGFDISQTLVDYKNTSSYAQAFWVGLANTGLVAALGIVLATGLGFAIGIARLSSNWLVARLALVYVETVRNVPLLLQLLIWYVAVLRALPMPQESLALGAGTFLDVRGLHMPRLIFESGAGWVGAAFAFGIGGALAIAAWAAKRRRATGARFPVIWAALGLALGLPLAAFLVIGAPVRFDFPELHRFNFEGGLTIEPEFMALLVGLATYTASFIAEIVRSGIQGVARGQKEAAAALGLRRGQALRLVVIPQAMRIIIPPLTNQYLNLTDRKSVV